MKKLLLSTIAIIAIALSGLQAQNATWSLPPNYYKTGTIYSLPAPDFGLSNPFNYAGLPAEYSHNAMQDASGNLLFFVVDDVVYDKDGYFIGYLQGNQGTELMIVPDPGNCDIYYIFYAVPGVGSQTSSNPYFAILDMSSSYSLSSYKFKCDYGLPSCLSSPSPVKH